MHDTLIVLSELLSECLLVRFIGNKDIKIFKNYPIGQLRSISVSALPSPSTIIEEIQLK